MHFHIRFEKAVPPTGILLALAGGRMEYLRLLKLLYISDREMIAVSLSPITGDRVRGCFSGGRQRHPFERRQHAQRNSY